MELSTIRDERHLPLPIGAVRPVLSLAEAIEEANQFELMKTKLLQTKDYQTIGEKIFIKRSGWRKLALVFNLSDYIMDSKRIDRENGSFTQWFKVRIIAPNGRFTEATGTCDSSERKFAHPEHDVEATAHTRAKSRGISDLIGGGEISAEEMEAEDSPSTSTQGVPPKETVGHTQAVPKSETSTQKTEPSAPAKSQPKTNGVEKSIEFKTSKGKTVSVPQQSKWYGQFISEFAEMQAKNPGLTIVKTLDEPLGKDRVRAVVFKNIPSELQVDLESLIESIADGIDGEFAS